VNVTGIDANRRRTLAAIAISAAMVAPVLQPAAAGAAPTRAVDPEARAVARLFVLTAVARRHLRLAYYLAGPQIRQDLTLAEWETGAIPVVPYPVDPKRLAEPKVEFVHPAETEFRVLVWSRTHPAESQYFVIALIKTSRGWLVNTWAPAAGGAVPVG
jgi:hypothetical protein